MKFKFTEQPDPVKKITFNDIKNGDLFQQKLDGDWLDVYLMTNHLHSGLGQCFNVTRNCATNFSEEGIDKNAELRILKIKDIEVIDFIY
jgi:hypothetical protein